MRTVINNPDGQTFNAASSGPPIAFAMKEDFPEVVEATRLVYMGEGSEGLLRAGENNEGFYEPRGYLADATIFNIFKFDFIEGVPTNALVKPNTICFIFFLSTKIIWKRTCFKQNNSIRWR